MINDLEQRPAEETRAQEWRRAADEAQILREQERTLEQRRTDDDARRFAEEGREVHVGAGPALPAFGSAGKKAFLSSASGN